MTLSKEWSAQLAIDTPIGSAILLDGQRYELVNHEPYTRRDGTPSHLLTFRVACADCGAPFEVKSGLACSRFARRCPDHRKGLKRVSGTRGDRVNVVVEIKK